MESIARREGKKGTAGLVDDVPAGLLQLEASSPQKEDTCLSDEEVVQLWEVHFLDEEEKSIALVAFLWPQSQPSKVRTMILYVLSLFCKVSCTLQPQRLIILNVRQQNQVGQPQVKATKLHQNDRSEVPNHGVSIAPARIESRPLLEKGTILPAGDLVNRPKNETADKEQNAGLFHEQPQGSFQEKT